MQKAPASQPAQAAQQLGASKDKDLLSKPADKLTLEDARQLLAQEEERRKLRRKRTFLAWLLWLGCSKALDLQRT